MRMCNTHACPVDCIIASWGKWANDKYWKNGYSACTKSCGGGSQRRSRTLTQPKNGGAACPHTAETTSCNNGPCPSHCAVSAFSAWTACTKTCGSGAQSRSRSVTAKAADGGYVCPYLAETRTCNKHACSADCVMTQWSSWSACTRSCGSGSQVRSRSTVVEPANGGKACPHPDEARGCNRSACAVDCAIGQWGAWSSCTKTCGSGSQTRTRVVAHPKHGGAVCPASSQSKSGCNPHMCLHVCSHTKCEYVFLGGTWRTSILTNKCSAHELHGGNFHCEHHFGTKTVSLGGGMTAQHTNECACYCSNKGTSSMTHGYDLGWQNNAAVNINNVGPNAPHQITKSKTFDLGSMQAGCK